MEDLEARLDTSNLLNWLDHEANTLAQLGFVRGEGVQLTGKLLRARNIEMLCPGSTVLGEHASIEVGDRGYVVRYREDLPKDRIRFSLAHEIGHTYWFDENELGKPLSHLQSTAPGSATIEHLCDFFAGALLLPRRQIEELISEFVVADLPPLHLVPVLAREFQVADQAVARRLLFQICPRRIAILRIKRGHKLSGNQTTTNAWHISWCAVPSDLREAHSVEGLRVPFLASNRAIPDDMVPPIPLNGETIRCMIDGRWWEGLVAQSEKMSRISFKSRPPKPRGAAFICTSGLSTNLELFDELGEVEYLYVALPL